MFVSRTNSNSSCHANGLKRKVEEAEGFISKKNWEVIVLGKEIIEKILSYLQFEDILKFESLSKNYNYLTENNWKYLKSTKFFNFDWSDCSEKLHPAKDSFLLSKAIHAYIHNRTKISQSDQIPQINQIYRRFESLMTRFPAFGAYLWYDLTTVCPSLQSRYTAIFNEGLVAFDKSIKDYPNCGGDFLLGGLYKVACCAREIPAKISVNTMGDIFILFKKAIELKASCASYFALKTIGNKASVDWHYSLGALSADQKDYRALDHLMNENMNFALNIYNSGIFSPSVVGAIANNSILFRENDLENYKKQTKTLLDNTVDCYEEANVPLYLWDKWDFLIKGKENKDLNKNSLEFFSALQVKNSTNSSYNSYDGRVDVDFRISFRQFQLGEWKEAEKWYDNLGPFIADRSNVHPLAYWIRKAYIKLQLEKWVEAEELYEGILELIKLDKILEIPYDLYTKEAINLGKLQKCNFKNNFWLDLAYIKLKLNKSDIALRYHTDLLKFEFNKNFNTSKQSYELCKLLYVQIKKHYDENNISFPLSFHGFGARISFFYMKWNEVVELIRPILAERSLTLKELILFAYANFMRGDYEIANLVYDKLSRLDRIDCFYSSLELINVGVDNYFCSLISFREPLYSVVEAKGIEFWLDYICLKIKLKKYEDAYMICYNHVINLLISNHINKFKSAENFLNVVLDAHETETPPCMIISWISDLHAGRFGDIKL